jgi:hypothetical protein
MTAVAKVKRNEPCPCGSGIKSKFCCKQPHKYVDVKVLPLDLCQGVVNDLVGTTEAELRDLFDQLLYLPELDTSLQVRLGGIITPEVERAIRALRCDDADEFDRALDTVVPTVDTLERRVELARAVVELRALGRIPAKIAALAVLELDREESTFFIPSVAESIAVLAGDRRTPAGLQVADR